ncbi:MAG: hypothetical protein PHP44_16030, partial [Kiritimatiellae bacterium]|nr:hypothetical protein [Kiritimatiellia bacterium]
ISAHRQMQTLDTRNHHRLALHRPDYGLLTPDQDNIQIPILIKNYFLNTPCIVLQMEETVPLAGRTLYPRA